MRPIRILGGLALAMAAIALTIASTEAGLKKSDAEVKISTSAGAPNSAGTRLISVQLDINDGWYIYANPVGNKDFEAVRTIVKVLHKGKEIEAKISYPAGKTKDVDGIGKLTTYHGKVVIGAEAPADAVTLHVRFQSCSEKGVCLLPATVKVNIP